MQACTPQALIVTALLGALAACAHGRLVAQVERTERIEIAGIHPVTMPIGVPDASTGFVKTLIGSLVTIVVYSLLR